MVFWIALMGAVQATTARLAAGWNVPLLELVVVYYGLSASSGMALFAAGAATLVRDALSMAPLGAGLIPLLLVAFLADAVRDHVFRTSAVTWVVCGLAATFLSILAQGILAVVVFGRSSAVLSVHPMLDMLTVPLAGAVAAPVVLTLIEAGNRVFGVVPRWTED
jgi:hypothetical protein